jgi:hypothetical protein
LLSDERGFQLSDVLCLLCAELRKARDFHVSHASKACATLGRQRAARGAGEAGHPIYYMMKLSTSDSSN